MCMDYIDLNKACPKDPYPLPNIDRLVDGASGFALLSFIDAYSGYNQIRMHPQDKAKTAFITDSEAFCYKVMPFGLKNARATYQRLMDKIFKEIMGIDVEVCMDDMMVKSMTASEHCRTLKRVFKILRKHQLKLNPEKCSFGGIEANLEKCQAVINMRSPQSVREVQQLAGRITALSCFISWLAETAIPIFNTLKKGGNFAWTSESEKAFLRLKAMLVAPPVLTWLTLGIPLLVYIYICVFYDAGSAVIIQEKEGNKVLQSSEIRYQKIEKATLALTTTSRRLRPYFQGYNIVVRADLPIRQVLQMPDLAGKMIAWSI
ncbi:Retrovirus-related Pol polyprotein from transposon 17.6, partial [Mucuna pruriens]